MSRGLWGGGGCTRPLQSWSLGPWRQKGVEVFVGEREKVSRRKFLCFLMEIGNREGRLISPKAAPVSQVQVVRGPSLEQR